MKDEIKLSKKEIIGICEFLKIHHFENAYTLLDYITNLQEEIERLNKLINEDNEKATKIIIKITTEIDRLNKNNIIDILQGEDKNE